MKRLLLLLFIAALHTISGFGQTNVRDSLQTLLDQAPDDTTRINLLVELSHVVPFPERSTYLNQALTLAQGGKYPIKEAAVYNKLGEWQFMTRQFEQAVITFQTSADIFASQDRYEAQSNMLFNAGSR